MEPQPDIFVRLKENYREFPNVSLEQAAISSHGETMIMYRFKRDEINSEDIKMLVSLSREMLVSSGERYGLAGEIEELKIPSISMMALLKKHNLKQVSLLQIDAEGYDYEIIKMIDFSCIKPTIINFEDGNLSSSDLDACLKLLCSHGYKVVKYAGDMVAYQQGGEDSLPVIPKVV